MKPSERDKRFKAKLASRRRKDWMMAILKRTGQLTCSYCTADCTPQKPGSWARPAPATIDHMRPLSRGGVDEPANWCVACKRCNLNKGSLTREEFLKRLAAPGGGT